MTGAERGKRGEDLCAFYYTQKGFTVIARNVHSRYGEIDLIAENETTLVFAEVKTRAYQTYGLPREAVDRTKQKKIALTAMTYLQTHPTEKMPRFDVFEVWLDDNVTPKVHLIPAAFDLDCLPEDF